MPEATAHYWHGSTDLLAQVARTAQRVAAAPACQIEVQVDGDREVFSSVRDFKDFVTPEALRRFEGIAIHADGSEVKADVSLRRLRPWWKPGLGNDTIVVATTSGADEEQAATAFDGIYAAVRRGGTETGGRWLGLFSLAVLVPAGIATAGGAIVLYLLEIEWPAWTRGMFFGVALVLGVMVSTWLYPSVEVTPPGNRILLAQSGGQRPPFVTLVARSLTKYLYG